jgi:hypothetical protein
MPGPLDSLGRIWAVDSRCGDELLHGFRMKI